VFRHWEVRLGIGAAVTDRLGGVSAAPYDELNLGDHVGDEPGRVADNRERVRQALGAPGPFVTMRQVHGTEVAVVDEVPPEPPEADALVTRVRGLVLVVLVADCTPVLLWDRRAGVVGAVHAGRRGLAAGVPPAAIAVMAGLGARPERMYAVVGPGICPDHYEVPAPMRDEVAAGVPEAAAQTSRGTPALDIRAGLLAQLHAAGLRQWVVLPECTAETPDAFSYRRDGTTGRFAGLVWREP
jgi:YfiH family protein